MGEYQNNGILIERLERCITVVGSLPKRRILKPLGVTTDSVPHAKHVGVSHPSGLSIFLTEDTGTLKAGWRNR